MRIFLLLCSLLLVSGCASHRLSSQLASTVDTSGEPALQKIRIERWGKTKFSGLLGLKRTEAGLQYVLLDGMGVKLLQGYTGLGVQGREFEVTGILAERGLAPFLAKALARIYLQEPLEPPCASTGLSSICVTAGTEGDRVKKGRVMGVTLWTVRQEISFDNVDQERRIVAASYSHPFAGVKISLHTLQQGR